MIKVIFNASILLMFVVNVVDAQPVKLHANNPHYFLYKGQSRLFITSAKHYGAVLNLDFDYKKYLQALYEEGMDYTSIFTGSYVENDEIRNSESRKQSIGYKQAINSGGCCIVGFSWMKFLFPAYSPPILLVFCEKLIDLCY